MKASPLKTRPAFPLMKQTDIQNAFHLQMPRWLFTDPNYSPLSLEAKVVYTFLLNRFQLSRLNGWINDSGEVFIIYTRGSLAEEIQLSYHKILDSMKELTAACLIWEKRCGRGDANQIYLAKVAHPEIRGGSAPFVPPEHEAAGGGEAARSAETEGLDPADGPETVDSGDARSADMELLNLSVPQDLRDTNFQNCQNGTPASAESAVAEVPFPHPSNTKKNDTNGVKQVSPSVEPTGDADRQAAELDEILENCELWTFEPETAKVFENAIERLFYSEHFRIGGAVLPRAKVRSHLWVLDNLKLQAAESKLHQNTERQIRNSTTYTMAVVFNTIWESESDLLVDPYLNHLRQLVPRGGGETGR